MLTKLNLKETLHAILVPLNLSRYNWNVVESGVIHHNPDPSKLVTYLFPFNLVRKDMDVNEHERLHVSNFTKHFGTNQSTGTAFLLLFYISVTSGSSVL
jgi:hypothetical protein